MPSQTVKNGKVQKKKKQQQQMQVVNSDSESDDEDDDDNEDSEEEEETAEEGKQINSPHLGFAKRGDKYLLLYVEVIYL